VQESRTPKESKMDMINDVKRILYEKENRISGLEDELMRSRLLDARKTSEFGKASQYDTRSVHDDDEPRKWKEVVQELTDKMFETLNKIRYESEELKHKAKEEQSYMQREFYDMLKGLTQNYTNELKKLKGRGRAAGGGGDSNSSRWGIDRPATSKSTESRKKSVKRGWKTIKNGLAASKRCDYH
jgi:acetoin utilization deacetylase AcuC-like enzyme